jgi:hypothetical protein
MAEQVQSRPEDKMAEEGGILAPSFPRENGSAPLVPHAADIVQQLRNLIGERELRLAELDREREQVQAELKTYEAAIRPLTGEARKKKGRPGEQPKRTTPSKLSPERLTEIEGFIRAYAADHEEFRQVDIRSEFGKFASGQTFTSGISAIAFNILGQEPHNLIRVARVDGNSKYYKLTRSALRSQP